MVTVKKLRVVLRWTGRALLVLLAILALFILEENIRGHILLARYKAELRAKGEKLTVAELNLPNPTKPSDAAVVLLSSGDELREFGKSCPFSVYMIPRLQFVQPGCCLVRWLQPDSGLKLVNVNITGTRPGGGRRYRAMQQETELTPLPKPPPAQMCDWEQFERQIDLTREPVHNAREALRHLPLEAPIDYGLGPKARIPQIAVGSIAVWLTATALDDLRCNRLGSASENILTIVLLTHFLQSDRMVILQQQRVSMGEVGLNITWEALQAPGWTDEQLRGLQVAWDKASVINEFEAATEVERAMILDEWDSVVHRPMREFLGWSETNMLSWDDVSRLLRGIVWYVAWRQQDQARGVWLWAEGVDAVRAAVGESKWIVARDVFKRTEQDEWKHGWIFYDQWRYQMSIPDMPSGTTWGPENLGYDVKRLLEYETRREMTVAAIALKRFELRHNKPAPDLTALVPEFLARVPHDYMDGGKLRYRLNTDGTWSLYSVGEDGVDNGGDPRPLEPRRLLFSIWAGRDAVWPQPALER